MLNRRELSFASLAILPLLGVVGCTNGQIDPQKIVDALKTGCGIAVALNVIVAMINAGWGGTAQGLIDLVCSSYKSSLAAKGLKAATGAKVDFVVVITDKNGKATEVPVEATVQ